MFKVVFLDLDNTIFSFDKMYEQASLQAIEKNIGLSHVGVNLDTFYRKFRQIADELYYEYEEGKRTIESYQDQRWIKTFQYFNYPIQPTCLAELNRSIHENYLDFVEPYAGAEEFLRKVSRLYRVGLITNGPVDMQMSKIKKMNLVQFFDPSLLIISESVGVCKPHPDIFKSALLKAGIDGPEALHIGDSVKHDILGANHAGMASALIHGITKPELATPTFVFDNFFEATKVLLD